MSIPVFCTCGQSHQIQNDLAGRQLACTACGTLLTVPPFHELPHKPGPEANRRHGPRLTFDTPPSRGKRPTWSDTPMLPRPLILAAFFLAVALLIVFPVVMTAPNPTDSPSANAVKTSPIEPAPPKPRVTPLPPKIGGSDKLRKVVPPPPTVAELIQQFRASSREQARIIIGALARRGPEARTAVPALIQAIPVASPPCRREILSALRSIGPPEARDAGCLLQLLDETSLPAGKPYALHALLALGPQVDRAALRKALPELVNHLGDEDRANSRAAAGILAQLGTPRTGELPLVRNWLGDPSPEIRKFAISSLAAMGAEAADLVPDLLERLRREKVAELRRLILPALLNIQPRSRAVIEACNRSVEDVDPVISRCAIAVLVERGLTAGAVPGLLRALQSSDLAVSRAAEEALAKIALNKTHAPAIAASLARPATTAIQLRLLNLLCKLGPNCLDALPALRGLLKNADDPVRTRVLQIVASLGSAAKEVGPDVAPLLMEVDRRLKLEASDALAKIEAPEAKQAVEFLVRGLWVEKPDDKQVQAERNRIEAILVKIGRPAVPRLIEVLQADFASDSPLTPQGRCNLFARLATIKVLGSIGAREYAPEILRALVQLENRDKVPVVRNYARLARKGLIKSMDN